MNPSEESEGKVLPVATDELIAMGVTLRLDPKAPAPGPIRGTRASDQVILARTLDILAQFVRALAFERGQTPEEFWRIHCLAAQSKAVQ